MRKQIANIITSSRILCSICLLLCPVFSVTFYIMYLFCGITDMVDGTIARKTKSASESGARLDSVADIVFVAVCFAKILPLIQEISYEEKQRQNANNYFPVRYTCVDDNMQRYSVFS